MTKQPYENLRFRIHNIPKSANLLEEFPELKKHPELHSKDHQNEILRYLIYMYDPKSDLIREESELLHRKKKAVVLAGFRADSSIAQSIVDGSNGQILEMGFFMLTRVYNDRKFREWCTLQNELEEKQQARWKPITEEDDKKFMEAHEKKGRLGEQSQAIMKALDLLESEIFSNNTDMKEKASVLLTTPEKVAAAYRI